MSNLRSTSQLFHDGQVKPVHQCWHITELRVISANNNKVFMHHWPSKCCIDTKIKVKLPPTFQHLPIRSVNPRHKISAFTQIKRKLFLVYHSFRSFILCRVPADGYLCVGPPVLVIRGMDAAADKICHLGLYASCVCSVHSLILACHFCFVVDHLPTYPEGQSYTKCCARWPG